MRKAQPVRRTSSILRNESGSVLILGLIMLAMLTVIGVSLTVISTTEVQISGNERIHKMAFYAAESGWQMVITWLDSRYPAVTDNQTTSEIYAKIHDDNSTSASFFSLTTDNSTRYSMSLRFQGAAIAPGFSTDFYRYTYRVDSHGLMTATGSGGDSRDARARVRVTAGKIYYVGGY